jgi:opacity protein-like surface antigen
MQYMKRRSVSVGVIVAVLLGAQSTAQAQDQPTATEFPWSVEFGMGWDRSFSGNINSSAIGRLNNQAVVITKNQYDDVYGTGLHLKGGVGYMLSDLREVRGTISFQSLDADLTPMGEYGASRLYGQYSDYQSLALDVGLRQYMDVSPILRVYGEATIGIGFVDKTDVTLVAPAANLFRDANDFYDQTAAFALGANGGVQFKTGARTAIFAQLGLRWVSGMAEIDDLEDTSLETINDKSARWTIPFVAGVSVRF